MKNERMLPLCALLSVALAGMARAAPLAVKKAAAHTKKAGLKSKAPVGVSRTADYFTAVPFPGSPPSPVFPVGPAEAAQSDALCEIAAAKAKRGDAAGAAGAYRQALALSPASDSALYGLAESAGAVGDTTTELGCYRQAIYSHDPHRYGTVPGDGYRTNDVVRMMEFALALNRAGQVGEAVAVYDRAAGLLNYQDTATTGKPFLAALLPDIGNGPGQTSYTPEGLEAMAHLTLFIETFSYEGYGSSEPLAHLQQALSLAPDSAAANLYMGKYLFGKSDPGAKAYLEKAARLGDDHTAASAKGVLQFIR